MFTFRLQRILELRAQYEQAKARALASAQDAAETARGTQDALSALRHDSQAQIRATTNAAPRIGHLRQLDLVLASLDARVERAGEVVKAADAQVTVAQDELANAAKDRRVLDRLKDRHAETFRAEFAQKDRLAMDEIALAQFTRKQDVTPLTTPDDSSTPTPSRHTDDPTR